MSQDDIEKKEIQIFKYGDIDDDDDVEEIVHIKINPKIDIEIYYNYLHNISNLVQQKYRRNEMDRLSNDLLQYQQKNNIKDENILSFFMFIENKKDTISIEEYFDYLKLNRMLKIKKMGKILNLFAQNNINDINFIIKKMKEHLLSKDDDENDEFMPEMESVLRKNINLCLKNEQFCNLPISIIYRIISKNFETIQENIDNDLLFNFINGSIKERSIFFSFLNLQKLSDDNLNSLQIILSNPEGSIANKPLTQSDLQTIIENRKLKKENAKLLSKKDAFLNELSSIMSILCKLNNESFLAIQPNFKLFIFAPLSLDGPGLINLLRQKEEHLYICSQSSNDICNVIDPKTHDYFSIYENGFVCFKLPEKVNICGFIVFSAEYDFPKTFNIEIDGNVVVKIDGDKAKELCGENKEMTIKIDPKEGSIVKLVLTGPQWEENRSKFIHICLKRLEILSEDKKYSKRVFETLIQSCENQDPHKCNVLKSAGLYDFNSFHSIDNEKQICTWSDSANKKISWFQIELTKGLAVISHCRIRLYEKDLYLKSFRIVGSDDCNIPVDEWEELFFIENNTHKPLDIYEFPKPSPPIKFIRLIKIEVTNPNRDYLAFKHLDFFGYYFPN